MKSKIYYNYEYNGKFRGIIDYKTLVILTAVFLVILSITNIFNVPFKITFWAICIVIPISMVLILCGNENESSLDVIHNIIRFYINAKIYCYKYNEIKRYKLKKGKVYKFKNKV